MESYRTGDIFIFSFPVYVAEETILLEDLDSPPEVVVYKNVVDELEDAEVEFSQLSSGEIAGTYEVPAYEIGDDLRISVTVRALGLERVHSFEIPLFRPQTVQVIGVTGVQLLDSTTRTEAGGVVDNWPIFQNTEPTKRWLIQDTASQSVNLEGHALKVVVHAKNSDEVLFSVSAELSESDPDDNPGVFDTVSATIPQEDTAGLLGVQYSYKLWDVTEKVVYGSGDLIVYRAPLPA